MSAEQNQAVKDALLQLLEPRAGGDVLASIAISLRKISDKINETPSKALPGIINR
jgi:hypothetical protein